MNKHVLLAFIPLVCLCACQTPTQKTDRMAQQIPNTPPARLIETPPTPKTNAVWDVSDVDVSYVCTERNLISFTFDDAPAKCMESLLSVFADYNQKNADCKATATVFCNGYFFDNNSLHTLVTAHAMGWEMGNHSYSHPDLVTLSAEEIADELNKTDALLEKVDGKATHLIRPPYGSVNDEVKRLAKAPIFHWTIDTLDWAETPTEEIYQQVMSQKFSGAVVLMHDNCPNTVEALKRLLPDLKAEGYQVVSLSAMAKVHECTLKQGSVYIRARKKGSV